MQSNDKTWFINKIIKDWSRNTGVNSTRFKTVIYIMYIRNFFINKYSHSQNISSIISVIVPCYVLRASVSAPACRRRARRTGRARARARAARPEPAARARSPSSMCRRRRGAAGGRAGARARGRKRVRPRGGPTLLTKLRLHFIVKFPIKYRNHS